MTLAAVLTFVGLLITSYSVFRTSRATVIEMFISRPIVVTGVFASAFILCIPLVVVVHDGAVPRQLDAGAQVIGFLLLMVVVVYLFAVVGSSRLTRGSAVRLARYAPVAAVNGDWPGLLTILRANKSVVANLLDQETMGWLFDSRFVRSMVRDGEWVHLEVLAQEDPAAYNREWRFRATDIVGRAMLDEDGTLLQKALASRFSSHETLRPTKSETTLLERTYQNPSWYMGLRADYALVLRAVEILQSGTLDEEYNTATWTYTASQGITTRWKCPVWVAEKTITVAIERAIESETRGDEYASDLLDILRDVVERSQYGVSVWEDRRANSEYPTPFAYLIYEIIHDIGELWTKMAKRGVFASPSVEHARDALRCRVLSMVWAHAVWIAIQDREAASEKFRISIAKHHIETMLIVGFSPYDLFYEDPPAQAGLLDSFRDLLLDELLKAISGDSEATSIVCKAVNSLDHGKGWVQDGGPWLHDRLERAIGCNGGGIQATPTGMHGAPAAPNTAGP